MRVKPNFDDEEGALDDDERKLLDEDDEIYDWDEVLGSVVGEEVPAEEGEKIVEEEGARKAAGEEGSGEK
jgi:hypothetical protein